MTGLAQSRPTTALGSGGGEAPLSDRRAMHSGFMMPRPLAAARPICISPLVSRGLIIPLLGITFVSGIHETVSLPIVMHSRILYARLGTSHTNQTNCGWSSQSERMSPYTVSLGHECGLRHHAIVVRAHAPHGSAAAICVQSRLASHGTHTRGALGSGESLEE